VKCDRALPSCHNCQRLGVSCLGYRLRDQTSSQEEIRLSVDRVFQAARVQRKLNGACRTCRASKSRCSRDRPACQGCIKKKSDCLYGVGTMEPSGSASASVDTPSLHSLDHRRNSMNFDQRVSPSISEDVDATTLASFYDPLLPKDLKLMKRLIDAYFNRVHCLGCLGFIHQPTLLLSLDRGTFLHDYGEALISIIFALGAIGLVAKRSRAGLSTIRAHDTPGQLWAKRACGQVMTSLHIPSIYNLMALILVCEYYILKGDNATVFTLAGSSYRLVRLLKLDSDQAAVREPNTAIAITKRESRRRLLWATYLLDASMGSGVAEHTSWCYEIPPVPLPQPESHFLDQKTGPEIYITSDGSFSSQPSRTNVKAYMIQICCVRTQVLKLIGRHEPLTEPWESGSAFLQLLGKLESVQKDLAEVLSLDHVGSHMLGVTYHLHPAYHAAVTDLTRVSLPGYAFPLSSQIERGPTSFKRQIRSKCYDHATIISNIIRHGLKAGEAAFDDPLCLVAAYESSKVQAIYTRAVEPENKELQQRTKDNIRINIALLASKNTSKGHGPPNPFLLGLWPLLRKFGFNDLITEWQDETISSNMIKSENCEVTGPAESHYLTRVTSFRLAQSDSETNSGYDDKEANDGSPEVILNNESGKMLGTLGQPSHLYSNSEVSQRDLGSSDIYNMDDHNFGFWDQYLAEIVGSETEMDNYLRDNYLKDATEAANLITWDGSNFASSTLGGSETAQ
jgi:hypothetical protein